MNKTLPDVSTRLSLWLCKFTCPRQQTSKDNQIIMRLPKIIRHWPVRCRCVPHPLKFQWVKSVPLILSLPVILWRVQPSVSDPITTSLSLGTCHQSAPGRKILVPSLRSYLWWSKIMSQELLAIEQALEEWGSRHPFQVVTDYQNLEYLREAWWLNSSLGPVGIVVYPN